MTRPHNSTPFTPLIPGEAALKRSRLPDLAISLLTSDAKLAGHLSPLTRETIRRNMAVINSYYSNLIEGNRTLPHEIRAAQRGEYAESPAKRNLQMESVAHIHVQNRLAADPPKREKVYSCEFLKSLHREFYNQLPEEARDVKNLQGKVAARIIPGEWRTKGVKIGRHTPPRAGEVEPMMQGFCEAYSAPRFSGERRIIAAMCAHHRFVWIHPFLDGNGRVVRLFTDTALAAAGLESVGVWCLSRGLARAAADYKGHLAVADTPKQGAADGSGQLSQKSLVQFCEFMLRTAIDQVEYMNGLLELSAMHTRIKKYIQARNDGRVRTREGEIGEIKDTAAAVLYHAFLEGELARTQAQELTGMPERSARRLIEQLKKDGLLTETSHRSPLRWAIPEHAEPWYFPELAPRV